MTQSFLEGVMQTIKRAIAIERRGDERAIHLRERTVIELLPSLDIVFGHALDNAIGGLDRLVAIPDSTGRRNRVDPLRLQRAALLAREPCGVPQLLRDVRFVITPLGLLDAIEESLIDDREPQHRDRLN